MCCRMLNRGVCRTRSATARCRLRYTVIGVAVLTVVLSWTVVNTVFTLRYAGLTLGSGDAGIVFGDFDGLEGPMYRDFAYVAFTIGMCY